MSSFYWYDLETFGIDPRFDRIAQFAGVRTDMDLNPIAHPDVFFCQPVFDYLPDPTSCLITGITPQQAENEGVCEKEFSERIYGIFNEPGSCIAGYNSIRFDDEFIRHLFYRNLYDPYLREYTQGNSRWDVIDLVRACQALRPDGINWPLRADGYPSFKLEELTHANNLSHESAHDALSDVQATIQIVKLIRKHHPRLFDYYFQMRRKNHVKSIVDAEQMSPLVHISAKISAQRSCMSILVPLMQHPRNANAIICYDLHHTPDALLDYSANEIEMCIYTPESELPDTMQRIHLKNIHLNKSPFVAPLSVLKGVDLDRINCNYSACKKHLQVIQANIAGLREKLLAVYDQPFVNDEKDVDGLLYAGFFSPQERASLDEIRCSCPDKLQNNATEFTDQRLKELVWRYKARNFYQLLDAAEQQRWLNETHQRLQARHGEDFSDWLDNLHVLYQQHPDLKHAKVLEACEQFVFDKDFHG